MLWLRWMKVLLGVGEIAGCFESATLSTSDVTSGCPCFTKLCIRLCFSTFLQGSLLLMALWQLSLSFSVWGGKQQVTKNRSRKHEERRETVAGSNDGPCDTFTVSRATWKACSPQHSLARAAWGDRRKWNNALGFLPGDSCLNLCPGVGLSCLFDPSEVFMNSSRRKQTLLKSLLLKRQLPFSQSFTGTCCKAVRLPTGIAACKSSFEDMWLRVSIVNQVSVGLTIETTKNMRK